MASNQGESGRENLKNVCVLQRGNHHYFPKTIPQERGPTANFICLYLSFLLFLADFITNENKVTTIIALYTFGVLLSIMLQLLYRMILMTEETKHLKSRYGSGIQNLFKNTFHLSTRVSIALILSLFYSLYYSSTNDVTELKFDFRNVVFLLPSVYYLVVTLELEACPLNDSLWIAKDNGLDYGSGMAYSFFHGYLKLVLPKTGTEEKNLKELMQDYEDQNQIHFAAYKLFILIPKSLFCFVSLKNEHSPSVDESNSLSEKFITVAGVQNRVYKNAVYKISTGRKEEKIYVSAEYATPLRTFLEVVNRSGIHTEYYDIHKDDIVLQFYLTLKKVLEKTGLNEFCELIYYEDYAQRNKKNNIQYYDVGEIILQRLKELKKDRQKNE